MKYDLHIHSIYSYDSYLRPENIIKMAKKRSLNGVAVADHGTIKGGILTDKANNDPDFTVVVGSEIKTEYGDIIGLFLSDEIINRNFLEVLDEIKDQDGLSVLAHPYRQYPNPQEIAEKVDLVEVFNARSKSKDNQKAYELAMQFKMPQTAGSDAHVGFEIGRGCIIIEDDLKKALINGHNIIEGNESNYYLSHGLSVLSEKFKKII